MPFPRLVAWTFLCLAAAALHAQTLPVEYATFMSHGKPVSCVVYDAHDATATIIFLRGSGPSDLALGRMQARFFAEHGFRVLLADYLTVTPTVEPDRRKLSPLGPGGRGYRRRSALSPRAEDEENRHHRTGPGSLRRTACRFPQDWVSTPSPNGRAFSPTNFFPRCKTCLLCSSFTASRTSRFRSSTPASLSASASSKTSPAKPEFIPTRATFLAAKRRTPPTSAY